MSPTHLKFQHVPTRSISCHSLEPHPFSCAPFLSGWHHHVPTSILEASSLPFSCHTSHLISHQVLPILPASHAESTCFSPAPRFPPQSKPHHLSLVVAACPLPASTLPPTASLFTHNVVRRNVAESKSVLITAMLRNPRERE